MMVTWNGRWLDPNVHVHVTISEHFPYLLVNKLAVFILNDCDTMFDFYKYHLWISVRYQDISWWVFMCVCEFDQYLQMNWRNLVLKNRKSAGYSCMLNDNDFEVGE